MREEGGGPSFQKQGVGGILEAEGLTWVPSSVGSNTTEVGMVPEMTVSFQKKCKLRPSERQAFAQGQTAGVGGPPVSSVFPT